MPTLSDFATAAQRWHDFYLLCGGAAATLAGLMFVAVTFGAGLVSTENAESTRAFVDPTLGHFVQVIGTACFVVMPTMTATVLGVALLLGMAGRLLTLVWVIKHLRLAHQAHGDIELSDWVGSVVLPGTAFIAIGLAGVGFLTAGATETVLTALAGGTVAVLALGVHSAWELMLWMAVVMAKRKS